MTDAPGDSGPDEPPGQGDPWDAWRRWPPPPDGGSGTDPWDAWKRWGWSPGQRPPVVATGTGCGGKVAGVVMVAVFLAFLVFDFIGDSFDGPDPLDADDLIAGIDALEITGPRDQRPPNTSAGETATFPVPAADPEAVAAAISSMVRPPSQTERSDGSVFLLYEEGTVAIQPSQAGGGGSEVVVFEDNRDAAGRFPLLLLRPGWSGSLDTFDARGRSRGGIGGFRDGGGGFGK